MITVETHTTESGSTYVVSAAFGATFVTRTASRPIDGLDDTVAADGVTVACDDVVPHGRWSSRVGRVETALRIVGGPWDGVVTAPIVQSVTA